MKKIIMGGIIMIFIISIIPFGLAEDNEYMKDLDEKSKPKDRDVMEQKPIIKQEEIQITRNSGSHKCDINPYCKRSLVNMYQQFYIDGEKHYVKKHWLFQTVTFYDSNKEEVWTGLLKEKGTIEELGLRYEVEDRKYSADRIRMYKEVKEIVEEN